MLLILILPSASADISSDMSADNYKVGFLGPSGVCLLALAMHRQNIVTIVLVIILSFLFLSLLACCSFSQKALFYDIEMLHKHKALSDKNMNKKIGEPTTLANDIFGYVVKLS